MHVRWTRLRIPGAVIAEGASTQSSDVQLRLWHRPQESRPWIVTVTVAAGGSPRQVYTHRYRRLPAAMANYMTQRDRWTAILSDDNSR